MQIIADLQLHSKYAQAVSKNMGLANMSLWAQKKGIGLLAVSDWTHPLWLEEIRNMLYETGKGVFQIKTKKGTQKVNSNEPSFLLGTEVSSEFYDGGRYRKIHILIFAPSFAAIEKINKEFVKRGQEKNMAGDGRPKIMLHSREVAAIVFEADSNCLLIPAHSWTPHYGYFGKQGGFDTLEEGFGEYAKYVYAVETGLGSDPAMNWRIAGLDRRNIVSFSDAHSLPKIGREATVFEVEQLSYKAIRKAITQLPVTGQPGKQKSGKLGPETRNPRTDNRISFTIEFYREEGKYHFTGHRKCGVSFSPEETAKIGLVCPICGKKLTVGAAQRTEDLSSREEQTEYKRDEKGVRWVYSPKQKWRPPFVNLVPLQEILSEVLKVGVLSKKVQTEYHRLTATLAPEFEILLRVDLQAIKQTGGERLAEAIDKVRRGDIFVKPGYDGVFGTVRIWPFDFAQGKPTEEGSAKVEKPWQEGLF